MDRRSDPDSKSHDHTDNRRSDPDSKSHDHTDNRRFDPDSKSHDHTDKTCKAMSKLLLPQDLMLYIFHLLPIYYLTHSARYVCKHWAATVATSTFNNHRVESKPGILVENPFSNGNSHFLEFKDHVNARFQTIYLPTPPNMGYIIGTCHGIFMLLARDLHIFLANPIHKCWLRLPPFPVSESFINLMNQCTIARVPHTAKFKLFFQDAILVSGAIWYVFYVLRVGIDNSWKEMARKEASLHGHISWKPLYSGDNDLYWITSEEIILIDVDKEIIVREYPHHHGWKPIYLWTGNHLSCIVTKSSYRAYEIHILDFDSGKWSLYHEMGPFDYMVACGHNVILPEVEFRLWIDDQIIFLLTISEKRVKYIHFTYNVKTKQFTKIEDIDERYYEIWVHTNSLVSLSSTSA